MIFSPLMTSVDVTMLKGILLFFSIFTLVFGALFSFSPDSIARLSRWANTVVFQPRDNLVRGKMVGSLLIILGIAMGAVLFFMK